MEVGIFDFNRSRCLLPLSRGLCRTKVSKSLLLRFENVLDVCITDLYLSLGCLSTSVSVEFFSRNRFFKPFREEITSNSCERKLYNNLQPGFVNYLFAFPCSSVPEQNPTRPRY